jgi:hypothetical protein
MLDALDQATKQQNDQQIAHGESPGSSIRTRHSASSHAPPNDCALGRPHNSTSCDGFEHVRHPIEVLEIDRAEQLGISANDDLFESLYRANRGMQRSLLAKEELQSIIHLAHQSPSKLRARRTGTGAHCPRSKR